MKKLTIALFAIVAAFAFTSCVQDVTDNGKDVKEIKDANTIAFTLASKIATRSAEEAAPVKTLSIPMGDPVDGYRIYLEETVTTLDGAASDVPETRGTPVYTENFSSMFSSFSGAGYSASGTTLTSVIPDGPFVFDSYWNKWIREFDSNDPFAGNEELYFFMHAPVTLPGVSNLAYSINSSGRCIIEFDYEVPLDATSQQDILFSGRPITKAESHNADILFHHAMTGIKFATDNTNTDDCKTYITKVEFPHQLFRTRHFKITTSWENGKWVDDPDIYSSAGAISFSGGRQLNSSEIISASFGDNDIATFEANGSFESKGEYADSFAAAGNTNNINDKDASKTFWFIPQQMNNNIVMDVTFHVVSGGKDSGPITRRINIGRILTNKVTWRAGELRTYTLKANLMDVDITDKVSGFEKTDVKISNTGNVDAFIRAHIVANWYGMAGTEYGVASGYTTQTGSEFVKVWKMSKTGDNYVDNYGGSFTGLPGSDWVQGPDGFFYYTKVVPAGKQIPSALFTKYAVSGSNIPPDIWYVDSKNSRHQFTQVELVMEIPVQAIEAEEDQTYKQAWEGVGVQGLPDPPATD